MDFKQSKPITIKILGLVILLLTVLVVSEGSAPLSQIIAISVIGILLLSYSISYEINADFRGKKHFKVFGITIFSHPMQIIFPDYITVFGARFKKDADWGPVAAMGGKKGSDAFVIRFFKGNRHFTVFKTTSLDLANARADKLGKLLNVEVKLRK